MKIIAILTLALLTVVQAGSEPKSFNIWTTSQLASVQAELASKVDAQKFAAQGLGNFGNHGFMLAHREGNGQAELHETQHDVFFVKSGEAILVIGGTVADPKTVAPHEIRGSSINGGDRRMLGAGDVVRIQAGTPHRLLVEAGKQFTYFVVKIDAK